jgi:glucokinase
MIVLAGDVGGTKTLLGLFDPAPGRPRPLVIRSFGTLDFEDLSSMIAAFLQAEGEGSRGDRIEAACFGVAGPVDRDTADLTNVPWHVDARRVGATLGVNRVRLLNDLEAMAYSIPVLQPSEVHVLQDGEPLPGNIALIAAGTGLGESLLLRVDGRFIASPSEGGHADFAARTERDIALMHDLTARFGRAEIERVVSGPGLVHIHRALFDGCSAGVDLESSDAPAAISTAALERTSRCCVESLDLFVEAYGAEAGNLALRTVSIGGLFIGGGIAPKILPALTAGAFMRAFRAKSPFEHMLARMPVKVIVNDETGLLGAAVYAAAQIRSVP